MIPVRRLLAGGDDNVDDNTSNASSHNEEEEEFGIVYINDEENQQPVDEEIHYMVDEEELVEGGEFVRSSTSRIRKNVQLIESVPNNIIQNEDCLSDYFRFRLGSLALFQKKTAQLGFPLRLILNEQENPTRVELTSENLPSYLLQEYMFNQENYEMVNNEVEEYVQSIMKDTGREKQTLLCPMIHLIKDINRMKFGWKSATSLEYKHAKIEKNQKRENEMIVSNQETQSHEYLENLPSVFSKYSNIIHKTKNH